MKAGDILMQGLRRSVPRDSIITETTTMIEKHTPATQMVLDSLDRLNPLRATIRRMNLMQNPFTPTDLLK